MNVFLPVILYSIFASLLALIGGVIFIYNRKFSSTLEKHAVPFAAGVLLVVSIMGLMPEAVHNIGENAFFIVLASFIGAFLFENLFFEVHHHKNEKTTLGSIPLVIIGDTIHNFIDGIAIASTYLVSPALGLMTTFSTFLHEVPHEIGDFGILLSAGWKKRKVLMVNIISASATVVGAILTLMFFQNTSLVGILLAIAAGVFLYLGASDFLPAVSTMSTKDSGNAMIALAVGASMMATFMLVFSHAHDDVTYVRVDDEAAHESREAAYEVEFKYESE